MDENNLQENNDYEVKNNEGKCRNYGLAVASMVCGIVSIVFFCLWYVALIVAALAIIFGIIVLVTNPGPRKGKGMAIAGIICGSLAILIALVAVLGAVAFLSTFDTKYFSTNG